MSATMRTPSEGLGDQEFDSPFNETLNAFDQTEAPLSPEALGESPFAAQFDRIPGDSEQVVEHRTRQRSEGGAGVTFPSGLVLRTASGATGHKEEHWDPHSTGLPLLQTDASVQGERLSPHFTVRELVSSGGTAASMARISPALVRVLEAIRSKAGKPVRITSGYRSWKRNQAVYARRGQTPTLSRHCSGQAVDLAIAGMTGVEIAKLAIDAAGADLAIGLGGDFIHVDVRGKWTLWEYAKNAGGKAAMAEVTRHRDAVLRGGAPLPPSPTPVPPPSPRPTAANRLVVDRHPMLAAHKGTRPDLILRWSNVDASGEVDVVAHFHGYSGAKQGMQLPRDKEPVSGLDFNDPRSPSTPGRTRPTLGILPRGHYAGDLPKANPERYRFIALTGKGELDKLIDDSLARLSLQTGRSLRRGRLILTAHSGGGQALLDVLAHMDPDEVHVFDALYQPGDNLVLWAKRRIARELSSPGAIPPAMRVLYRPGTKEKPGTQGYSETVARALCASLSSPPAARLISRFRVERTSFDHNRMPAQYGWRLLANAGDNLPDVTTLTCPLPAKEAEGEDETFLLTAEAWNEDAGEYEAQWNQQPHSSEAFDVLEAEDGECECESDESPGVEGLAWLDMEALSWNEGLDSEEETIPYAQAESFDGPYASAGELEGPQAPAWSEGLDHSDQHEYEYEGEEEHEYEGAYEADGEEEREEEWSEDFATDMFVPEPESPPDRLEPEAFADTLSAGDQTYEDFETFESEDPPSDKVDSFLESRRSLYKVELIGTNVNVTLPRSHDWTTRYTPRALTEGGVGAALNAMYTGGVSAARMAKAYEQVVGKSVKLKPAAKQQQGEAAVHAVIMDEGARDALASALNFTPKQMVDAWRMKISEARLIQLALASALRDFDQLVPHFAPKALASARLGTEAVRRLLDKHVQMMIETAKRHTATAAWRTAFKRNYPQYRGGREPAVADLGNLSTGQWAQTVLALAAATRDTLTKSIERRREEDRKHARNEHLRPHEVKATDAAKFILENFEPTQKVQLYTTQWIVHGGQTLTNLKGEPIYLLNANRDHITYQHVASRKFYKQTLEGFSEEQLYGIYVAAGEKSKGVIALTKWVIGVAGAIFPPVRYTVLAADVLNSAFKLQSSREVLERSYESVRLAYDNIDKMLPGVMPKVWDAVLDKRNAVLFNPLKNPDLGAWLKVIIRLVMERQARVVSGSYASEAVTGFLNKAWSAIKKGLTALWEVVKHVIIIGPAVVGSTGVSGHRALELAKQRLSQLGVADAAGIVLQIQRLSKDDRERLSRELQDLAKNATKLIETVGKALSW